MASIPDANVQALLRLLPEGASRPRLADSDRATVNAALTSLTRTLASPDAGPSLRAHLASSEHKEVASSLANRLLTVAAESVPAGAQGKDKVDATPEQCETATLALRVARNLVAGQPDLQVLVWDQVELLTPLLAFVTAFAQVHDDIYRPLTRAATQLLSNLLMANEKVQEAFWERFLVRSTSKLGQAQLLLRLLASPDHSTLVATLVILLTCCRSSTRRSRHLATSSTCRPLQEALLALLEQSFQDYAEDEHDIQTHPTQELDEISNLSYTLLSHFFSLHLFGQMYHSITPTRQEDGTSDEDDVRLPQNPITASHRTLLSLFDAYLHSGASDYTLPTNEEDGEGDVQALMGIMVSLSNHLRLALAKLPRHSSSAASPANAPDSSTFDARTLIGVPQAVVLVVQCMTEWILLGSKLEDSAEEGVETTPSEVGTAGRQLLDRARSSALVALEAKRNGKRAEQHPSPNDPIGAAVTLLAEVAQVFPAESPFKTPNPSASTASAFANGAAAAAAVPEGHILSHTGASSASQPSPAAQQLDPSAGGPGKAAFAHLKRELVRLLGVLSFAENRAGAGASVDPEERAREKQGVKAVQDYVRELDGLLVVLGMTQLDELNPYIREHAVFALRNLLAGNQANQDLIAQVRRVDENMSGPGPG